MEIYKNYLEDFMYIHQKLKSIYIKELKSLPKGKLIGYLKVKSISVCKFISVKMRCVMQPVT